MERITQQSPCTETVSILLSHILWEGRRNHHCSRVVHWERPIHQDCMMRGYQTMLKCSSLVWLHASLIKLSRAESNIWRALHKYKGWQWRNELKTVSEGTLAWYRLRRKGSDVVILRRIWKDVYDNVSMYCRRSPTGFLTNLAREADKMKNIGSARSTSSRPSRPPARSWASNWNRRGGRSRLFSELRDAEVCCWPRLLQLLMNDGCIGLFRPTRFHYVEMCNEWSLVETFF